MATQLRPVEDYAWVEDPEPDDAQDRAIWAQIDAALCDLHAHKRHAIRVLDLGCGCGRWLIRTAERARELGFTAIEGRGVDPSRTCIDAARSMAMAHPDPAIGLTFDVAGLGEAIEEEEDEQASDIVLCVGNALDSIGRGAIPLMALAMTRCADAAIIATVGLGKSGRHLVEVHPLRPM